MTEQLADKKRVTNCLLSRQDKERRLHASSQPPRDPRSNLP